MKVFEYASRDASGATHQGTLKATDRADAIRQLAEKGHTPVLVNESRAAAVPKQLYSMLGLAALVLVGGTIAVRMLRKRATPTEPPATTVPAKPTRQVTPLPPPNTTAETAPATTPPTVEAEATPQPADPPTRTPRRRPRVNRAERTPDTETDPSADTPPPAKPPTPFRRPESLTEQVLNLIGRPGDNHPPIPPMSAQRMNADFAKFLATDLTVHEDDPPEIAEQKTYMGWMQLYMREAQEQGMEPAQFLDEMVKLRQEEAAEIQSTMQLYREIVADNPAEAERARAELNKALEEKGLPPLPAPRLPRGRTQTHPQR